MEFPAPRYHRMCRELLPQLRNKLRQHISWLQAQHTLLYPQGHASGGEPRRGMAALILNYKRVPMPDCLLTCQAATCLAVPLKGWKAPVLSCTWRMRFGRGAEGGRGRCRLADLLEPPRQRAVVCDCACILIRRELIHRLPGSLCAMQLAGAFIICSCLCAGAALDATADHV